MALTESQIKERNRKIREEFADTEEELNEIHERQMAELPDDYDTKLKEAVNSANESFKKNVQKKETQETVQESKEAEVTHQEMLLSPAQNAVLFSSIGLIAGILLSFIALKLKNGTNSTEQKKAWVLRPIAWICTAIMVLAVQFVAELICRLGEYLIFWLGGLSTVTTVVLVLLFGSAFFGLFFYSAFMLPALLVTVSDKIYPSHYAFRYYFFGLYEIAGCAFLIYAAIIGAVKGGSMFWFYARYGYLILTSIFMMLSGRSAVNERNASNQSVEQ